MTALLDAHQVSASIDGEVLLAPVSAHVSPGHALAVLGQNGSGKTTLLRILAGLLRPTSGTVSLGGSRPNATYPDERRRDTRRAISALIGLPAFATDLTVREQLRFIATSWGIIGKTADDRADSALEQWGISALSRRFTHELSSGQTQLFALATAFIRPFDILILDEPEQRLDRDRLALVSSAILTAKANGSAVIVATHSATLADAVADARVTLGQP
ncbi:ABC transporter ATP-binding protein [Rathayibacter soli]|uniref:ABC transporter ATP-binding protein n=1 Tax=Rathayibacter soli TaxID=3144168 RepID=UPI0027E4714F|nr:ABC transporter ATP-binding protein [Glaciibacter superstes]